MSTTGVSKYFTYKEQSKESVQTPKRTHSEVANSSGEELQLIMADLDMIKDEMKNMRGDLQGIVSATVKEVLGEYTNKMQKEMEEKVGELEDKMSQKIGLLSDKIDGVQLENNFLREKLAEKEKAIREMKEELRDARLIARDAQSRSNQNEQYSRKNNIKIQGVAEQEGEETESIVCKILKDLAQVQLGEHDIVAAHRIPGKQGQNRPILLKLKNAAIKTKVMKKRSVVKNAGRGIRLVDDVTRFNALLIKRLTEHPEVDQAWYYNGGVFGKTVGDGRRIKFDIHDDISLKVRKK